jgi:hypothetical protein
MDCSLIAEAVVYPRQIMRPKDSNCDNLARRGVHNIDNFNRHPCACQEQSPIYSAVLIKGRDNILNMYFNIFMDKTKFILKKGQIFLCIICLFISCSYDTNSCWACNGKGKCSTCTGEIWIWVEVRDIMELVSCTSCRGTGTCYTCKGTGKKDPFL